MQQPYGHGHNYAIEVSARGPLDDSGRAVDTELLDALVQRQVLQPFGHRNLNLDVEIFERQVPTSENLAVEICRRLKEHWSSHSPESGPNWTASASPRRNETSLK